MVSPFLCGALTRNPKSREGSCRFFLPPSPVSAAESQFQQNHSTSLTGGELGAGVVSGPSTGVRGRGGCFVVVGLKECAIPGREVVTSGDLNGSNCESGPEGVMLFSVCVCSFSMSWSSLSSLSAVVVAQEQMSMITPNPLTALIKNSLILEACKSCSHSASHCNRNVTLPIRDLAMQSIA